MKASRLFQSLIALSAAALLLIGGTAGAQTTTSSMRVVVTDDSGNATANVSVDILHVPTGRLLTTTSNESGIAIARNLAVGGPYSVSVSAGSSYSAQAVENVMTNLDETQVVTLRVSSAIEEIKVVGQQPGYGVQIGVGREFDRADRGRSARNPALLLSPQRRLGPTSVCRRQRFTMWPDMGASLRWHDVSD